MNAEHIQLCTVFCLTPLSKTMGNMYNSLPSRESYAFSGLRLKTMVAHAKRERERERVLLRI